MREALDIRGYAPQFKIKINGMQLDAVTSRSINAVSITKKIGMADNFSFTVQDKMAEAMFKLMDDRRFKLGNKVSLSIGYQQGKTINMQGHIEEIKPRFSGEGMYSFEVSGKDKALARLAQQSGYRCYTRKTDSDIVKAIAWEVGLTPRVDSTRGRAPEKKEKKGGTSYLAFINKMVRRNKGFEFMVSDGNLVFREAGTTRMPVKELEWGRDINSFEPRADLSRIITGVKVRWWDEKKQAPIIGTAGVNDETAVGSGTTAGKIARGVYGTIEKTVTDEPVDSKDEARKVAISVLCDKNKELVTAEVETVGTPVLDTGEMVGIKGVADMFCGNYYIHAVVHTIDGRGYRTQFSIRRNTI